LTFFAKINPVWVGGVYYNQQDISDGSIEAHLGYVQMMYSFGINVRVSILMLGFEYEIGSLKLKMVMAIIGIPQIQLVIKCPCRGLI